jgi:hypothetical protein
MRLSEAGEVPEIEHQYSHAAQTRGVFHLVDEDKLRRDVGHGDALGDQFGFSFTVPLERQVPHRNLISGFRV